MIHILPPTNSQGESESLRMDLLVSLRLFVHGRVSDGLAASAASERETEEVASRTTSVYASLLIYLLSCSCVQSCFLL